MQLNSGHVLRPLVVVMGVSGSGKSTIGALLAADLHAHFVDGDALHPASNVAKMAAGIPLDDADRWPWLAAVGHALATAGEAGIVVACSSLKRVYRDAITAVAPGAVFVELDGSHDLLEQRIAGRHGHFMPSSLLDSQLATLEPLESDERGMRIDIEQPEDAIVREAVAGIVALAGA
jgi:carbohydrate kinase (thermoresistant glucokinase family)